MVLAAVAAVAEEVGVDSNQLKQWPGGEAEKQQQQQQQE